MRLAADQTVNMYVSPLQEPSPNSHLQEILSKSLLQGWLKLVQKVTKQKRSISLELSSGSQHPSPRRQHANQKGSSRLSVEMQLNSERHLPDK